MAWDLVVVGAGLAGLTAANRAAERGLSALVLEAGAEPDYPCNSRFAGGLLHVAYKDIAGDPAAIRAVIDAATKPGPANALAPLMAEEGARALAWLRAEGGRFIRGGAPEYMRWVLAPPRPRRPGLEWKGRGPDVLLRRLEANLATRGGEVRRGVRVRDLLRHGLTVTGVRADTRAGTETVAAAAVVIADGGFQGNPDLLRRFVSPRPERLFQRGAGTGRGDGLAMAEAAGARLVGTDTFYGHLLGREVFHNAKLWPYPTVDAVAQVSILVDGSGRRFADEDRGGVFLANAVARQEDPGTACVVFDDQVWTGAAADNRYPPCMNPSFVSAGGTVFQASDLGALARAVGVPPAALAETVAQFNAAVREGQTGRLTPPRGARTKPRPIVAPPFRAIQVCAGITYTMGGIAIDADGRVLARDAGIIDGLYAAGSATGGAEGGPNAVYLGGLAKAAITGLRAGEAISRQRAAG